MKQYPEVGFSEEIMYAACHNLAYDQQCEYDRGHYIFELISLAPQKKRIFNAVWATLVREKSDDYGLNQMYDIAVIAAKAGDAKARSALYKRFEKSVKPGWSRYGSEAIIGLDGPEGVLKIADLRGRMLLADPEDWEDSFLVDDYQRQNPTIDIAAMLKSAAKKNKNIAFYLEAVYANSRLREASKARVPYTYEFIKQSIETSTRFAIFPAIKDLTADQLHLLARDFLSETRPIQKQMYLRLFAKYRFPLGHKPILKLINEGAKGQNLDWAIQALSYFRHSSVRKLFDYNIRRKNGYWYLPLLNENYKDGDDLLLTDLVRKTRDKDKLDAIASDMRDIYVQNPTPDCTGPIEAMYEKLNCGLCRKDLLNILLQYDVLPERIRQEMAFDSNKETRELLH